MLFVLFSWPLNLLPLVSSTSFSHFPELLLFYFLASCQIYGDSYLQAQMFQPTSRMTVWHDSTCSMENHDMFFWLVLTHNSISSLDKKHTCFPLAVSFLKDSSSLICLLCITVLLRLLSRYLHRGCYDYHEPRSIR